ncbi:mechanosensitive ion channel family protein, partial [Rhizobium ruizarguesonis]
HASSLLGSIQSFPQETMRGGAVLERDIQANGGTRPIFLVSAFVAVGLAAQWLFCWISAGWRSWMARAPFATVRERMISLAARLLWARRR